MSTALDFRSIHQHPPSTAKSREPLPADPSWDAHKVYFNEREKDVDKKGDEFDDFFAPQQSPPTTTATAPPKDGLETTNADADVDSGKQNPSYNIDNNGVSDMIVDQEDETLDPLGWPIDAFRSMAERVQSTLTIGNNDDDDGDDMNLLRKSDEDDGAPTAASTSVLASFGDMAIDANQLVEGVQNLFLYGSTTKPETEAINEIDDDHKNNLGQDDDVDGAMNKEDRIRMYESTGMDDESSVEEEDDDDQHWDDDRDVGFVLQNTSNDEDDVVIQQHDNDLNEWMEYGDNSGDTTSTTTDKPSTPEVAQFSPDDEQAAVAAAAKLPVFSIPQTNPEDFSKKKKNSGPLPLLRPPPAEKLQKWEAEKARPMQHLQGLKK